MSVSAGSGARAASSQRDGRVSHRGSAIALEDDPDEIDAAAERDRLARRAAEEERAREEAAALQLQQQQQQRVKEEEEKAHAPTLAIYPTSPSSQQPRQNASSPTPAATSRPASALAFSPGGSMQHTAGSQLNSWSNAPGSNAAADPYTRHLHETIRDLQSKVTALQRELQLKSEAMSIAAEAARRKADDQSKRLRLYKTLFAQMLVSQYVKTWRSKRTLFRIQDLVFNLLPYVLKEYERNPSNASTFDSSDVGFDGAAAGAVGGAGAAAAARRKANESAEATKLANAEHVRKEKARMEREHDAQIAAIYASTAAGGSVPTSPAATTGKRQLTVSVQEAAPLSQDEQQQDQQISEPSPIDSGILQMSPTNARAAQQQQSAASALTSPTASDSAGPSSRRARAAAQAARDRPRHLQLDVTPADVTRMGRLRKVRRGTRMLATPIVQLTSYIEDVLLLLQQAIIALIARLPLAQAETERLAQRNVELKGELTDLIASQQYEKQELKQTRAALAQLRTEHERLQRSYEIVRGEKDLAVHHLVLHGGWNPGRETQFGSMSVAHLSRPTFYRPREKSQLRTAGGSRSRSASPAAAAGVGRGAASEQAAAASSSSRAQSASRSRPRSAAASAEPLAAASADAADDGSETDFLFQRDIAASVPSASASRRSTATAAVQPSSSLAPDAADACPDYSPEEKEVDPAAQSRGRSSARRDPRASSRSPSAGSSSGRLRSSPYRSTDAGKNHLSSSSSQLRPHSAAYMSSSNKGAIAEERTLSPERGRAGSRQRSASPPATLAELVRSASARASLRELSPGRPSALFTSNKRFDSGDIGGTNMYLGVGSKSFDRLSFANMEAQQRSGGTTAHSKSEAFNEARDTTVSKRDRILEARREQLAAAQAALDRRERKRLQAQAEEEAAQQQQYFQQQKSRARRPSSSPSRHASYQEHIAASPLNVRPVTATKSRPSSSQKLTRPLGASASAGAQRGPVVRRVLHFPSQQHEESAEDAEERAAQLQRSLGKPRRTALEAAGLHASHADDDPEVEEPYPDSETVAAATFTIRDEEGGDDTDDELAAPVAAPAAATTPLRKTPTRAQAMQKSASAKRIADSPYKQQQSSHSHKKHAARHQPPTDVHMIDLAPISSEQRQQRQQHQQQQDRPPSAAARKVLSRAEELHVLATAAVATSPGSISARAPPSSRKAESPPPPTDIAAILAGGHDYESYVREIEGDRHHEQEPRDAPHERRRTEPARSLPAASSKSRAADSERESQRRAQKAAELAAKIEQAKHTQQQLLARSRRDESKPQPDQARRSSPKRSPPRSSSSTKAANGPTKLTASQEASIRAEVTRKLQEQEQERARAAQALSDDEASAQFVAAATEAYERYQNALKAAEAARAVAEATKAQQREAASASAAARAQVDEVRVVSSDPSEESSQDQPAVSDASSSSSSEEQAPLEIESTPQQIATAAAEPSPSSPDHSPDAHVAAPTSGGGGSEGGFRFQLPLSAPALSADSAYAADFVEPAEAQQAAPASPILSSNSRSGTALRIVPEEQDDREAEAQAAVAAEGETSPGSDAGARPAASDASDSRPTSAQRMARFKANMKKQ